VRTAVVSDIHGNLTAFDAVIADIERQSVDRVVHGGDLVLMGAQPAEVIDRVRELGWPGIVGNTDEALWRPDEHARQKALAPRLAPLLWLIFHDYAPATQELIGDERLEWLRRLPVQQRTEDMTAVHAAPCDLWRAPMPDADDAELAAVYAPLETSTVVYGHIHRPYTRTLDERLTIANTGSVGMPFDGDARASYLLVEDGRPRPIRVEYDVEREAALLLQSGYPDVQRLAEMRRRGTFMKPMHISEASNE
jgi:putative phosphoesterase